MNILVTGATGFLGGVTARRLTQAGHQVTGLGRNVQQGQALEKNGISFLAADLREPDTWGPVLRKQDAVIHCAARSTLWGNWQEFYQDNVVISRELAAACAGRGLRFVHISSPSIYNASGLSWQVPEHAPVGPRFDSLYARSKYLAEQAVQLACPDAALLRPRGIYGPGDTSILPRLVRVVRTGRLPRLTTREVHTELTHVTNVAYACELAVTGYAAGPFNITDGFTTPIWATIDQLADHLGVPRPSRPVPARLAEAAAGGIEALYRLHPQRPEPPVTAASLRLLTRPMTLDLTRAAGQLGYAPLIHPQDGVQEALRAAL